MAESDLTIGKIFLVLERYLFSAMRRVLQGKEKAMVSIVYETIWSWFLRYFDEDKAGVMEAIRKG
ncbi:unknown [Clostridium sp. CAG:568]|nr:unknown [Clostridium sp. CAG:568]